MMRPKPIFRKQIAVWSPMPPLRSGIADWCADLVPHLAEWADVDVYTSYAAVNTLRYPGLPVRLFPESAYEERSSLMPYDLDIYQLGNNNMHLSVMRRALLKPGLVVLHDLSLSSVLYYAMANTPGGEALFLDLFKFYEGEEAAEELKGHIANRDHTAIQHQFTRDWMSKPFIDHSRGVLSLLPYATRLLDEKYHPPCVGDVYIGSVSPFESSGFDNQADARKSLGLSPGDFLIGIFGFIQPTKQVEVAIKALDLLIPRYPHAKLVLVGKLMNDDGYGDNLRRQVHEAGLEEDVIFTEYVDRKTYMTYILACDAAVSLRYPSHTQMSGSIAHIIAGGKPLVVSDVPEWRFLPETFTSFVPADDFSGRALAEELRRLIVDPQGLQGRCNAALRFQQEQGTFEKVAASLYDFIEEVLEAPKPEPGQHGAQLAEKLQIDRLLEERFNALEASRNLGKGTRLADVLRKLPGVGKYLHGFYRLMVILATTHQVRPNQFLFESALVNEVNELTNRVTILEETLARLEKKLEREKEEKGS